VSRRKHAVHEEEHENSERWLLTYADLITLLLALFMMLYAMSQLDLKKYQAFQQAFTQGMGKHVHALPGAGDPPNGERLQTLPGATTGKPVPTPSPISDQLQPLFDQEDLKKLKALLDKELKKTGLTDQVQVSLDNRGLVINVVSAVLFDSGQATLTYGGQRLLTSLGSVVQAMSNKLVIEGHTDARPISTPQFPSNWELSTTRATSVLRYLITKDGVDDQRLSAAGYADTHPLAANDSEAGMARNRRVDLVVIAGPAKPHPSPSPASSAGPSPGSSASPNPTPSGSHGPRTTPSPSVSGSPRTTTH
jgi:chemotaxis protein MotB